MRSAIPTNHSLHRWFSGLVQDAMYSGVGVGDPGVVDYLAELLVGFIHTDRIFALRDDVGRPIDQVADMLATTVVDPSLPRASRERVVHRHIGDFTLFWTGVFPEALQRLCDRHHRDYMLDYHRQGKRSYAIASDLTPEDGRPPGSVLRRLSEQYECCVQGLGLVRQEVRAGMADATRHDPIIGG